MNKKIVWTIIIIIALIVIGLFVFSGGDDTSSTSEGQGTSAGTQQDNTQIETSEDVLDEIDSAVGYLE